MLLLVLLARIESCALITVKSVLFLVASLVGAFCHGCCQARSQGGKFPSPNV